MCVRNLRFVVVIVLTLVWWWLGALLSNGNDNDYLLFDSHFKQHAKDRNMKEKKANVLSIVIIVKDVNVCYDLRLCGKEGTAVIKNFIIGCHQHVSN